MADNFNAKNIPCFYPPSGFRWHYNYFPGSICIKDRELFSGRYRGRLQPHAKGLPSVRKFARERSGEGDAFGQAALRKSS